MNKTKYFVEQLTDRFPSLVIQSSGMYNNNNKNKNYTILVTFLVCMHLSHCKCYSHLQFACDTHISHLWLYVYTKYIVPNFFT